VLLGIYNEANLKCFETTIPSVRAEFGPLSETGQLRCYLPELPLFPGRYYINVGLYPISWDYIYDYHWQMHEVYLGRSVDDGASGVVRLHPTWSVPKETC